MLLLESMPYQSRLLIRRKSYIDDLDLRIFDQFQRCLVNSANVPSFRNLRCPLRRPRSDRDNRKARRRVRQKLNIGHDKSSTDTADLKLSASDLWIRFKVEGIWHIMTMDLQVQLVHRLAYNAGGPF